MDERIDDLRLGDAEDALAESVRKAMAEEGITHYTMSLVGEDIEAVIQAVNIGIDAHLTACNCLERGDSYEHGERSLAASSDTKYWKSGDKLTLARTLECRVSAESLPVLLRRLGDAGSEAAWSLRSAVLSTLNIEE